MATTGVKRAMRARSANELNKRYAPLEPAGQSRSQQPPSQPKPPPPQPVASVPQLTPYAPGQAPLEYTRPPLPPGRTATVAPSTQLIETGGGVRSRVGVPQA